MRRRTSSELDELVKRVAEWRERNGGRGSRIPDEVWQEAVRVSGVVGVWATAQALHFNYQALRRRVDEAAGGGRGVGGAGAGRGRHTASAQRTKVALASGAEPVGITTRMKATDGAPARSKAGPGFIALEMGPLGGGSRTVIDLVSRHGDRMRFEVAGEVDIVSLAQALWSRQP